MLANGVKRSWPIAGGGSTPSAPPCGADANLDALMTMTPSPVSMCGVNRLLPRMMRATSVARRPRSLASTTYQSCWMSAGVALNVLNMT